MDTCKAYPVFEKNQVLTAEQLNELTTYLETHQRLTRSKLLGIGIVCGLEIDPQGPFSNQVNISEGCGITSEGYLVSLEDSVLTRYSDYTDPVHYPPFWPASLSGNQYELCELLPQVTEAEDETIQDLTSAFLQDKVVILYVECKEVDKDTCTGDNCNELGKHIEQCIRKLLIKKSDLEAIMKSSLGLGGSDTLEDYFQSKYLLPEISIGRSSDIGVLKPEMKYEDLQEHYIGLIEPALLPLEQALKQAWEDFNQKLELGPNPFQEDILLTLFDPFKITRRPDIQYFYDFIADLVSAYNEFKSAAFEVITNGCSDPRLFPRHLALSEAVPIERCLPSIYRQSYVPAPVYNEQHRLLEKAQMLFKRMVLLIQNFDVPANADIRVTPSKGGASPLSERAVPYYYNVESGEPLVRFWNYENSNRCRYDLVLSYHAPEYSKAAHVLAPLQYQNDNYPFLRVEGHIGKSRNDIEQALQTLVEQFNLPIKTLSLALNSEVNREIAFDCRSEDLELIYVTCRDELVCLLQREIRFFSEIEYTDPQAVYEDGTTGVKGTIKNEKGEPLVGVNLVLTEIGGSQETFAGTSGVNGAYQVVAAAMPAGEFKLSVSLIGYRGQTINASIVQDKVLVVDVILAEYIITGPDFPWFEITKPVTGDVFVGNIGRDVFTGAKTREPIVTLNPGAKQKSTQPQLAATAKTASPAAATIQGLGAATLSAGIQTNIADFQTGDFLKHSIGGTQTKPFSIGQLYLAYGESGTSRGIFDYLTDYLRDVILIPQDLLGDIVIKINRPIQMVTNIENLITTLTPELKDFNVEDFQAAHNELTIETKEYKDELLRTLLSLTEEQRELEREVLEHLNAILENCSFDKFQAILNAFQSRQDEIRQMLLFSNFFRKHPGLEHQAGVPKGGTFVFVHDENDVVVGDFALPYICCSDCPPITIINSSYIVFKLPKTTFCFDDNNDYYFILSPPGGQITDAPGVQEEGSTGNYTFNPTRAGVEPGTHIFEYIVNGNTYQLAVSVVQVQADFTFQIKNIDTQNDSAEVTFTATPQEGETFTWDFGDGTASFGTINPVANHVFSGLANQPFDVNLQVDIAECSGSTTKTVQLIEATADFTFAITTQEQLLGVDFTATQRDADAYAWSVKVDGVDKTTSTNADFMEIFARTGVVQNVEVTLVVSKGQSQDTVTKQFTVPANAVKIGLASSFCKSDPRQYAVSVFPAGGILAGPGISQTNKEFFFAPASNEVNTEKVTLKYTVPDGRTATKEITVSPIAAMKVESIKATSLTSVQVTIQNNSTIAESYTWDFGKAANPVVHNRLLTLVIDLKNVRPGQVIPVTLTAVKDKCQHATTEELKIPDTPGGLGENVGGATFKLPDGNLVGLFPTTAGRLTTGPIDNAGRNVVLLQSLRELKVSTQTLSPDDPVYKETISSFLDLQTNLRDVELAKTYVAGKQNGVIATAFDKLLAEVFGKISKIRGGNLPEKRQFLFSIVLIEINQLLSVVNFIKDDIKSDAGLFNTLITLNESLVNVKQLAVNIDPDKALANMLTEASKAAENKPNYGKAVSALTKTVR